MIRPGFRHKILLFSLQHFKPFHPILITFHFIFGEDSIVADNAEGIVVHVAGHSQELLSGSRRGVLKNHMHVYDEKPQQKLD